MGHMPIFSGGIRLQERIRGIGELGRAGKLGQAESLLGFKIRFAVYARESFEGNLWTAGGDQVLLVRTRPESSSSCPLQFRFRSPLRQRGSALGRIPRPEPQTRYSHVGKIT